MENNKSADIIWFLRSASEKNTEEATTPLLLNHNFLFGAQRNVQKRKQIQRSETVKVATKDEALCSGTNKNSRNSMIQRLKKKF